MVKGGKVGSEDAAYEVERLAKTGVDIHLLDVSGQCYALVRDIEAPSPPWNSSRYDILIAIPAVYPDAALDAFYLSLPYTFHDSTHPRVNGATISVENRQWQLTSWHYPDGKPWRRGLDDLDSHITHCRGFFSHRGALNEYR
jgi:hypothetical protein